MIRLADEAELKSWDKLVLKNPDGGHIYQSYEWGEYKAQYDWLPTRLMWESGKSKVAIQTTRKSAAGFGTIWYLAKGPGMFPRYKPGKNDAHKFAKITEELAEYIKQADPKALMIMVDPELQDGSFDPRTAGWKKSVHDLQFKATIIVDIDQDDEALLASFKQKTRYNIRLAIKKGVVIEQREATDDMVDTMYGLMKDTQGRAGFFLRPKEAFKRYWQSLAKSNQGRFFVAVHEGEILAAEFAMIFGDKAYYKEGGSSGAKRNLMAPYLLQYEVMRWARDRGAKEYDLIAVPPKAKLTPEHSMYGLYQFKSGFHEEITEFIGGWEYPLNTAAYARWLKFEPWFHRIYHRLKHNLFW